MSDIGERITAITVQFQEFEKYNHERWHKLNNDLQPLVNLPLQIGRDIAKLEGKIEAKIDGRLSAIEVRLSAIEAQRQQVTGAQRITTWIVQTVLAAIAAFAAVRGIGR